MEIKSNFPLIGDKAPSFEAQTTDGPVKFPEDYEGSWVILFSHPADFTPVCTTEFVAFQKRFDQFQELNCKLIGLSIDQVFSHLKWLEWINERLGVDIQFPIIGDYGQIGKLYGMIHPGKASNTVRAVFIIDPKGIVRAILYYPQELGRNMDEILRMLKGLQLVDEHKVSIPANWPNNELIGDNVIVPPPRTKADMNQRLEDQKAGECECYDWWLCYKKL